MASPDRYNRIHTIIQVILAPFWLIGHFGTEGRALFASVKVRDRYSALYHFIGHGPHTSRARHKIRVYAALRIQSSKAVYLPPKMLVPLMSGVSFTHKMIHTVDGKRFYVHPWSLVSLKQYLSLGGISWYRTTFPKLWVTVFYQ